MKNKLLLVGIAVALLAIGTIGYYYMRQPQIETELSSVSSSPVNVPLLSDSTPMPSASPVMDEPTLRAGGSSFRDPQGIYVFLYPSDYTIDSQNGGKMTRIYKRGEMQRPQSEMSDGVIMNFEDIHLESGQSLEKWIDAQVKQMTADGTVTVAQPKKAVTVNGNTGFTFTTHGLGEATYMVLQKDASSQNAVQITSIVADPQQKGYQSEVTAILSTVEVLK